MTVTIYTKAYCGYCRAAKSLLQREGLEYKEIPVDRDENLFQEMVNKSQRFTVPQIFFDDEHIGGYTDLVSYL